MNYKQKRINYLFTTTKGLILINIAIISLVVALFGMLSGPLKEWGLGDLMVRFLGMDLQPQEREGRIIMLYHTIAIAFLSLLVYIITDIVKMKPEQVRNIRNTITVGYLMVVIFGLGFAYWGHNWSFHGLFLVGQTLVFYSGILLTIALWPWNKEYYDTESDYAHTKSGFPLERAAFWIMSVSTLGSAVFGAVAGASFGNGFETFLAENGVRHTHHSPLDLAVIGHLHIMLTLIGIATALIIGRWYDWKGILHKIGMWLFIIGTIIITLGVWAVVPYRLYAHAIIYVGAVFSMSGALMLVIFGWRKLMGFNSENKQVVGFVKRIKMLINDAKVLCFNHPGCTFLHYVERELRVPYRFDKSFICEQIIDGKKVKQNWKIWVRYLSDDKLIHSPKKFVEFVKDKSIAKFSEMGRGEILAIPTSMVFDSVKQGLQNDPWFLINADRNDSSVLIDKQYK